MIWRERHSILILRKQLGVILFEKLEMPHAKKTKTGYSTAADVLDKLAPEYPIVAKILEYRQLAKLKSTYADGLATLSGRMEGFTANLIRQLQRQGESAVQNRIFRIFRCEWNWGG